MPAPVLPSVLQVYCGSSGVGQPVQGAVPWVGSSKRPSHSSTARLLVMMKLDTPCRWSMRSWRSADCWAVDRCRPRSSGISRSGDRKDLQVPLKGVVDSGLGYCPEVVVGMDEADSVSRPDGGVAQGLGQENSCPLPPDLPSSTCSCFERNSIEKAASSSRRSRVIDVDQSKSSSLQ